MITVLCSFRKRRLRAWAALAGMLLVVPLGCLAADPADDTLLKLAQTGRITLGVRDHLPPTLYRNAQGESVGYQMDICKRVVDAIKQRFDLPGLKVVTVTSTFATRFALLNNGTTDLDCGPNPINAAGLRQALFTHADLLSETRVMGRADNTGLSFASLQGKTVATVAGNTVTPLLRAHLRKSSIQINEVFGRHADEVFAMLEAGRVDAVLLNEPYLLTMRAASATPERYVLLEGALRTEPIAMMVRLQDEKLLALINEVVASMMRSGEMERLYNRWFVEPPPGQRVGLNMPLPPALRALFARPGSEMLEF